MALQVCELVLDAPLLQQDELRVLPSWRPLPEALCAAELEGREMVAGQECGIGLEGFEGFEAGDKMETFRLELEEI